MTSELYAMDTNFHHSLGSYEFDARCELLAELGYSGTSLSVGFAGVWDDLKVIDTIPKRHQLKVVSVYQTLDLGKLDNSLPETLRVIDAMGNTPTLELAINASGGIKNRPDPDLHGKLLRAMETLLPMAEDRKIQMLLYPHIWFYIERIEQAVAVCREINSPRLGVIFTSFHWYAVDGKHLSRRLQEASPYLRAANICGSRRNPPGVSLPCSIECLDEGELDNFALLGSLDSVGFNGPVGLQGYSNGGDVYTKLKRSLAAYKDLNSRLKAFPHWATIRRAD